MLISLFIQFIAFNIFGLYYSAINGIGINFTLDMTNDVITGFDFYPSQFLIAITSKSELFILKINLVAIAMLFYTSKVFQQIKN